MVLREPTDDFGTIKGSIEPFIIISCDDNTLVHLCLLLQNQVAGIKLGRVYQSLHGKQDPIELKYATKWDDPLPKRKPRLSPARRKMNVKVVAADYEAGGSLRELAAKYGVDKKTVALQLRKVGLELRKPGCNVWTTTSS